MYRMLFLIGPVWRLYPNLTIYGFVFFVQNDTLIMNYIKTKI